MKNHVNCSHIINIYQEQENPPHHKGSLYLSGVDCLKHPIKEEFGINCVLSIIDSEKFHLFKVKNKVEGNKIEEHKWIDIFDYEDQTIYPHLEEAHSYIKDNLEKHNVLVHCQLGMSRSSSLVIAFMMKEFGFSFEKARNLAKSKRPIVCPNESFEKDLLRFQDYLQKFHPNIHKN